MTDAGGLGMDEQRLDLLRKAIQKNWWLGTGACLSFLFAGHKVAAVATGLLILAWNGVLSAVAHLVREHRRK